MLRTPRITLGAFVLVAHFGAVPTVRADTPGQTLYALGLIGDLYGISPYSENPDSFWISVGHYYSALAIDPTTHRAYAIETRFSSSPSLYEINLATGGFIRFIGRLNLYQEIPVAMAIDGQGQAYLIENLDRHLYRLDKATATLTSVGDTGYYMSALALDADGSLYGSVDVGAGRGSLIHIDPDSALASPVGSPGVFGGLAIDTDGTLYGAAGGRLYRIDKGTGNAAFIGSVGIEEINNLAFLRGPAPSVDCAIGIGTLCLNDNRFRVEVRWRDYSGQTGSGHAIPFRNDSGLFWFFGPTNLEMLIKVINGCGLNQRYWVYGAATTDVEYLVTVTDTATGISRQYFNALGNRAAAITDSDAFETCGSAFDSSTPKLDPPAVTERSSLLEADVVNRMGTLATHDDATAPSELDSILYDQMSGAVGAAGAIMSQDFETARASYDSLAADDFVVPASGWRITSVEVDGQYNNQGPAASFHVSFYTNGGGQPGALVASRLTQPYTGTAGDAAISFTSPVVLSGGTYWIAVQARQDEVPNGWWFWGNRNVATNNSAVWRNPGNGWGTGCTSWGNKLSCLPGLAGPDQLFRLKGSASSPTECAAGGDSLCLNDNRFRVRITWRDYNNRTGSGWAVPYADDSGMFWFFGEENIEFLVKVIDGCGLNSKYWVYAAATTDVEYTMTVTDTLRNITKTYTNPLGTASPAITDSSAFATCP